MATDAKRRGSGTESRGFDDAAVLVGGIVTVVAAFLPWFAPATTAMSMEGNATITGIDMLTGGFPLFSGGVTILLAVGACATRIAYDGDNGRTVEVLLGVVAFAVAAVLFASPGVAVGGGMEGALVAGLTKPGIGAFGTLLGSLGIVTGGLIGYYG